MFYVECLNIVKVRPYRRVDLQGIIFLSSGRTKSLATNILKLWNGIRIIEKMEGLPLRYTMARKIGGPDGGHPRHFDRLRGR